MLKMKKRLKEILVRFSNQSKNLGAIMLQISKDYRINIIDNNVVLESRYTITTEKVRGNIPVNAGKEMWRVEGYFASIKNALKKWADLELRKSESMIELIQNLNKLDDKITELLKLKHNS